MMLKGGSICPESHGFVADRDKVDNSNDDQLNGKEYHFDPTNHQFLNNSEDSVCNEPENNKLGLYLYVYNNYLKAKIPLFLY